MNQLPRDRSTSQVGLSSPKGILRADSTLETKPKDQPVVPDYELLKRIGHGAYGDVWLARSKATGVLRAAKIVWRHTFEDERPFKREFEGIQRFERISREHPSQLALFHIGRNEAQGYFYYVMELADPAEPGSVSEGQNAAKGISRTVDNDYTPHTLRADLEKGRLPAAKVLEIGLALSEALSHLHANGLVHRDVKPSNVIFVNGRPKLADIGLVTDASDQCSIVGTEGYLPPEGPGTPQADIFALGKVLYEATTGLDRRQLPQLPDDLRSWPDAQQVFELNEVILKACESDQRRRYKSAEEMRADLTLLQGGQSVRRRHVFQGRLRTARGVALAAAAVTLTTAAVAFLWQTINHYNAPVIQSFNQDAFAGTQNAQAREAYALGLKAMSRGTPAGYREAEANFREATNADPKYVAAYARLFETHLMSEDHGFAFLYGKREKMIELSSELVKLAPTNADTHAARAIVLFLKEWKWTEAEQEFQQALRANPDCLMALTYYGYMLTRQRRASEANTVLERALKVDPGSPLITKFLGHCEYVQRHYEKARQFYIRSSEHEPSYPSGHYWAGRVHLALTNYPQALDEFEQYWVKQGLFTSGQGWQKEGLFDALQNGERAFWIKWIELMKDDPYGKTPYLYAEAYSRLHDKAQALTSLEKALDQHDSIENLLVDEFWDDIRDDPKFIEILKKVGLDRTR